MRGELRRPASAAIGLGVGLFAGLSGLAGGVVLIPALALLGKLPGRFLAATSAGVVMFSALAGALGGALSTMVANLSVGKAEYDDRYEELCEMAYRAQDIKDRLLRAVDEDTEAFNEVIAGMRMPKDTAEQKETRATAIRAAIDKYYGTSHSIELKKVMEDLTTVDEASLELLEEEEDLDVQDLEAGAVMRREMAAFRPRFVVNEVLRLVGGP